MSKKPVFIISYNWLTYLKNIIKDILRMGGTPVILDNASTYPPLLDYLKELEKDYLVYRSPHNLGPYGLLRNFNLVGTFYKEKTKEELPDPLVLTDPDLDLSAIPDDGLDKLFEAYISDKSGKYIKYGFSIEYRDIKGDSWRNIQSIQEQTRLQRIPDKLGDILGYNSSIDTTFNLYAWKRAGGIRVCFGPAFRLKEPYTCRHLPYYWNANALKSEEIAYYLKNLKNLEQLGYSKTFVSNKVLQ